MAEQILSQYWRSTYDILVRPAGARSPIESQYGLVEPNHLSGISGGISISQYEAIKAIPDVEVAAPVAMLGYLSLGVDMNPLGFLREPGVYRNLVTRIVDDGVRILRQPHGVSYIYVGSDAPQNPLDTPCYFTVNPSWQISGYFYMNLLLAGIEPSQEAKLVQLDQAIVSGRYLLDDKPLVRETEDPLHGRITEAEIPVLISGSSYISATLRTELVRFDLPAGTDWETIVEQGCEQYVQSFPEKVVAFQEMDFQDMYSHLVDTIMGEAIGPGVAWDFPQTIASGIPSPIHYRIIQPPFQYNDLLLEIAPPPEQPPYLQAMGEMAYRSHSDPYYAHRFQTVFLLAARGIFTPEKIPNPPKVNWVPLETYAPPLSILRYDENGQPVKPRPLRPSFNIAGYIQSPPSLLTTLEAARLIAGDDCISAIRVRVGGIDQLTPQAQHKIEAVASEIHRKTGLDVDIMVGSSPRPLLVHVPGIGYVEEQWVQKNVTLSYHRRIQSGHLLLIAALLLTGGLFAADMAWADLLARQPVLALQKALGWRSSTLMEHVLRRALLLGVGAGAGGAALAASALALARYPLPPLPWLLGIPLLVAGLSLLGSLYPALQAGRVPPIPLLRMAGLRHRPMERGRDRSGGVWLLVQYALRGVVRRWSRSLIAGMTAALGAGLLALLVGVVTDRAGYLSGTLLGEYLLIQIQGYHWWLVGAGLGLAAVGLGNSLLAGVLERQREIGVLKAVGWRTGAVARLFLLEGAVLGLLGGAAGTALGLAVYLALYRSVGAGLLGAVLAGLGVPAIVGVLAAAYPARVAAAVPPAEAVRGE